MDKMIVLNPGLQTTVQDLGRFAHQIDGFPTSGCMDTFSSRLANLLVGNNEGDAVIECCLVGGTFLFKTTTFIAFTGGNFDLKLNEEHVNSYQAIQVHNGDVLAVGNTKNGRYGYLAVAGGILEPEVMGSRSTTIRIGVGGHVGRSLQHGDMIPIQTTYVLESFKFRKAPMPNWPHPEKPLVIRILKGPQWNQFNDDNVQDFLNQEYTVTPNSDRMGYRLNGQTIPVGAANMLSEATVMGGIQISSDGQPIVLLADRQTTGGYPVIGVIIAADIHRFVQSMTKQLIKFKIVTLDEAYDAIKQERSMLDSLKDKFRNDRFRSPIGINRTAAQRIDELFD